MNVVVLAAGMGKRMRSELPKVLHTLAGRPLLAHVLETARSLEPRRLVVVHGHGGERVMQAVAAPDLLFARQDPPRGTGHAVMQALPHLDDDAPTLVLYGDVPLTDAATLRRLLEAAGTTRLALLTVTLPDPTGYGRIVRASLNAQGSQGDDSAGENDDDRSGAHDARPIRRIVEEKDATPVERTLCEINTGILVAPTAHLRRWLAGLTCDNAQGEYYLTDIVACAVQDGVPVVSATPGSVDETLGVNDRTQLADLERRHQARIARRLMQDGVQLMDPARLDVRGTLVCGRDVVIDVNVVVEGEVRLGNGVRIGAHCVLKDTVVEAGAHVLPFCHLDGATVGEAARIGPYARLRPGTVLAEDTHVGNFVEVKNSRMDAGAKANHLAYVGDADVGARVNIGAGTITCNYDGANKHRTVIEEDAFIGSDTQLVAPVRVGRGATLGAGTTLTRDAPPGALVVTRPATRVVEGWQRPVKKKA